MKRIRADNLRVAYNGDAVVDGVELDVGPGEWVMVLGPNGAGKTSILRALAGLVRYGGNAWVDDRQVLDMPRRELARLVALVPQAPVIPEGMSVHEYVALGRTPHLSWFASLDEGDEEVIRVSIERLRLTLLRDRHVGRLSGGERQRAVLARALAQEASVLLLDEPTSALDVGHQQDVLELIDVLRGSGLAVLSAMHDLNSAAQFADRIVMLREGKVIATGAPEDVIDPETVRSLYGANVRVIRERNSIFVVSTRT